MNILFLIPGIGLVVSVVLTCCAARILLVGSGVIVPRGPRCGACHMDLKLLPTGQCEHCGATAASAGIDTRSLAVSSVPFWTIIGAWLWMTYFATSMLDFAMLRFVASNPNEWDAEWFFFARLAVFALALLVAARTLLGTLRCRAACLRSPRLL